MDTVISGSSRSPEMQALSLLSAFSDKEGVEQRIKEFTAAKSAAEESQRAASAELSRLNSTREIALKEIAALNAEAEKRIATAEATLSAGTAAQKRAEDYRREIDADKAAFEGQKKSILAEFATRDQSLTNRANALADREGVLANKEAVLSERENALSTRKSALDEMEKRLNDTYAQLRAILPK